MSTTTEYEASLTQEERLSLQRELSIYLEGLSEKRGSDGQQLVHYPDNFDVVANAMNRNDLTSAEEKPWSKYLLASADRSFDETLGENGRYSSLRRGEVAEHKLDSALAQMLMYDKQLMAISRKAAQLKSSLRSNASEDGEDNQTTGRTSSRSRSSTFFLTRTGAKSDKSAANTPRSESGTSAVSSPEGQVSSAAEEQSSPDAGGTRPSLSKMPSVDGTASSKSNARQRNLIKENINAVNKRHSTLSPDEEFRLQTLLDIDEGGEAWQSLSSFGFTDSQLEQLGLLDDRLRMFNRIETNLQNQTSSEGFHNSLDQNSLSDESTADYLTTQRVHREQSAYSNKLDSMIRSFSTQKVDLTGLVAAVNSPGGHNSRTTTSTACLSTTLLSNGQSSSILEFLPLPSTVDSERRVSLREVEEILQASKMAHHGASLESLEGTENQYERAQLASRQDIDRLLSTLRNDIRRLAELRSKTYGHSSSRGTPRSSENGDFNDSSPPPSHTTLFPSWNSPTPLEQAELEDQMALCSELEQEVMSRYGTYDDDKDYFGSWGEGEIMGSKSGRKVFTSFHPSGLQKLSTASFLPDIMNRGASLSVATAAGAVAQAKLHAQLPLIAESFRRKIKNLKVARGLIDDIPPRPPSAPGVEEERDKRIVII